MRIRRLREKYRYLGMYHKKIKQELSVCVVTYPLENASGSYYNLIIHLLEVLSPLVHRIFLITGNFPEKPIKNPKVHIINIEYKSKKSILKKILQYLVIQIKISYNIAKVSNKINGRIFILSGTLLLPTIVAKICRKKTVLTTLASESENAKYVYKETRFGKGAYLFSSIIVILELVTCKLSNQIILDNPHVTAFLKLSKYQNKIYYAPTLFLNLDAFKPLNKICERENIIGYVGRLSEEKGVLNFVKAIPKILEERAGIKILVVGEGYLRREIEVYLKKENLTDKVKVIGVIPHEKVPEYLNKLRLLVLPSYTEALPGIVLEVMACGTPVLATPVGGVPDVITDGETGFIMENNSAESIAENVMRALKYPDLEGVVKNARELVEKEYTYEAAVERYRKILKELS